MKKNDQYPFDVALLRKVRDRIRRSKPETFDMDGFACVIKNEDDEPCGTAFCIAGHGSAMRGYYKAALGQGRYYLDLNWLGKRVAERKMRRCDIADWDGDDFFAGMSAFKMNDRNMAARLFYVENWPMQFRNAYRTGSPTQAAVDRINHFIKTKGAE